MLQVVVDTLLMHLDIWASMDIIDELVSTLTAHMMALEARGAPTRQISVFLREVGAIRQASEGNAEVVAAGSAIHVKVRRGGQVASWARIIETRWICRTLTLQTACSSSLR